MESFEFGKVYHVVLRRGRIAPVLALYEGANGTTVGRAQDTGRQVTLSAKSRIVADPGPDPADDPETVDRWRAEAAAKREELFGASKRNLYLEDEARDDLEILNSGLLSARQHSAIKRKICRPESYRTRLKSE